MQDVDIIAFSAHGSKAHPPPLHHWDEKKIASAGNRTRVTSMATMYSTTRPLMPCIICQHACRQSRASAPVHEGVILQLLMEAREMLAKRAPRQALCGDGAHAQTHKHKHAHTHPHSPAQACAAPPQMCIQPNAKFIKQSRSFWRRSRDCCKTNCAFANKLVVSMDAHLRMFCASLGKTV
jgi:hypothetical protein